MQYFSIKIFPSIETFYLIFSIDFWIESFDSPFLSGIQGFIYLWFNKGHWCEKNWREDVFRQPAGWLAGQTRTQRARSTNRKSGIELKDAPTTTTTTTVTVIAAVGAGRT